MKSFICILVFVTLSTAASLNEPIPILNQNQDISPDGSFQSSYETGNGISAQEQGVLKNAGKENEAEEVQGSFSYTADDGTSFQLSFANENGIAGITEELFVSEAKGLATDIF